MVLRKGARRLLASLVCVLGLAAGFWSFRGGLPTEVQIVFANTF